MNVINTDKFHTLTLTTYKLVKLTKEDKYFLTLLKYYFSVCSAKYPNEELMTKREEELYDTSFDIRISQFGKYSYLMYRMNSIDPKYIGDEGYTVPLLLKEYGLFKEPLLTKDGFNAKCFQSAKKQMMHALRENEKSHEFLSLEDAFSMIFRGTVREAKNEDGISWLKNVTKDELYSYFLKYKSFEESTLLVGSFPKELQMDFRNTVKSHEDFLFQERSIISGTRFHHPAKTDSMYLKVFYDPKIFSTSSLFYAASILNYALGGSSYSHLFRMVRERYGMCYTIDSDYLGASGLLVVNAVIDKKNLDDVLGYIKDSLKTVMEYMNLEKIKRLFLLTHREGYDSPGGYMSDMFLKKAFPSVYDSLIYDEKINSVSEDDIKRVLDLLGEPYFIYSYGGEGK